MEKMRFEQFAEEIVRKIRSFLPESFSEAEVDLQPIIKNNNLKLTGLTIRNINSNVSPTIYLEKFYDAYMEGEEMGNIMSKIAETRIAADTEENLDVEQILNYDRISDRIIPKLVEKDWNAKVLEERPHRVIADLAVSYQIMLSQKEDATATVQISNKMMAVWGIDEETLYQTAIHNMRTLLPSTFEPMDAVLQAFGVSNVDDLPQENMIYVLSNASRFQGATAILDRDLMTAIVKKFGKSGFFLLPSSVNEWILTPATEDSDVSGLNAMINEINLSQVSVDERLSSHAYHYSLEEGLVSA